MSGERDETLQPAVTISVGAVQGGVGEGSPPRGIRELGIGIGDGGDRLLYLHGLRHKASPDCYRFANLAEAIRGLEALRLAGPELVCGGQAEECSLLPRVGGQVSAALCLEHVRIGDLEARSLEHHFRKDRAARFCRPGKTSGSLGL